MNRLSDNLPQPFMIFRMVQAVGRHHGPANFPEKPTQASKRMGSDSGEREQPESTAKRNKNEMEAF